MVNDGAWKAVSLSSSSSPGVLLPGTIAASARVAVSETGTSAAFYDSDNSVLTVVTGIQASLASTAVGLGGLPGPITRLAVADDGSLLLTSALSPGGEALYWIGQDGSTRQLATMAEDLFHPALNSGATALVTDRAANQIWTIQNPGDNAAISLAASDADGVSDPVGAALSADGNQLWIANGESRKCAGYYPGDLGRP